MGRPKFFEEMNCSVAAGKHEIRACFAVTNRRAMFGKFAFTFCRGRIYPARRQAPVQAAHPCEFVTPCVFTVLLNPVRFRAGYIRPLQTIYDKFPFNTPPVGEGHDPPLRVRCYKFPLIALYGGTSGNAPQYIFLKKFSFWVEGFWISWLLISREVVSPE